MKDKVLRLKDKKSNPPFEIREIWRDPKNPTVYFYQLFRGKWEVCGWLADDCYKVSALVENEATARTIVEAMELLCKDDSQKVGVRE